MDDQVKSKKKKVFDKEKVFDVVYKISHGALIIAGCVLTGIISYSLGAEDGLSIGYKNGTKQGFNTASELYLTTGLVTEEQLNSIGVKRVD